MRVEAVSEIEGRPVFAADSVVRLGCRGRDHRTPTKLLELSLWLYSALLLAATGPTAADDHLRALRSTEGVAAALHAAPVGPAQAGAARAAPSWTGARAPAGSPLPAVRVAPHASLLRVVRQPARADAPDVERIALGFLAERSLAPPRLG